MLKWSGDRLVVTDLWRPPSSTRRLMQMDLRALGQCVVVVDEDTDPVLNPKDIYSIMFELPRGMDGWELLKVETHLKQGAQNWKRNNEM
jgi:hypothetical protein